MALQHLYSRVPAKISMFNEADGFDTFACSEGLSRNVIEKDLSAVYGNKPGKEDSERIRNGKLPPVYFHYMGKEGDLIHSCMSFLPRDYTGERTSYMVHSLVVRGEEQDRVLSANDKALLNPELFLHDLNGFDLTSFDSTWDNAYPEKEYIQTEASLPDSLVGRYDPDMLKRLIYGLLTLSCGKGKNVYFSITNDPEICSTENLSFLNTVYLIFPRFIREKLSFVSFTDDANRYNGFRVKGVLEKAPEIPLSKAMVLHFCSRIALGLEDSVVRKEGFLVEFFYDILCSNDMRLEFLYYMEKAAEKDPSLKNMNMKTLRDMVLLFCQCSGRYEVNRVLPNDDAVLEFVTAYDKYREAILDEYRAGSMRFLSRYPESHTAIPSKIFSKISKLYGSEPPASRNTIMTAMLELIHTDAMRDKLFSFMRANYADESDYIRSRISDDLCRVYYGGFLRPQILDFFLEVFGGETEENRDNILEKILLTVRTDGIRQQLITFFDRYYSAFSAKQKDRFFITYFEILPKNDALAQDMSAVVDRFIAGESDDMKKSFLGLFFKTVERDMRTEEHRLLQLVASGKYAFLADSLAKQVFGDWSKRVIFDEYIALLSGKPIGESVEAFLSLWRSVPSMKQETADRFYAGWKNGCEPHLKKVNCISVMKAESRLTEEAGGLSPQAVKYTDAWRREQLYPAMDTNMLTVFSTEGGIACLEEYAKEHPFVRKYERYKTVERFCEMKKQLEQPDQTKLYTLFAEISEPALYGRCVSLLTAENREQKTNRFRSAVSLGIIRDMKDEKCPSFTELFEGAVSSDDEEGESGDGFEKECRALTDLLSSVNDCLKAVPDSEKLLFGESSDLKTVTDRFRDANKKQAEKWISVAVDGEMKDYDKELLSFIGFSARRSGGFFGRLFGKK